MRALDFNPLDRLSAANMPQKILSCTDNTTDRNRRVRGRAILAGAAHVGLRRRCSIFLIKFRSHHNHGKYRHCTAIATAAHHLKKSTAKSRILFCDRRTP